MIHRIPHSVPFLPALEIQAVHAQNLLDQESVIPPQLEGDDDIYFGRTKNLGTPNNPGVIRLEMIHCV